MAMHPDKTICYCYRPCYECVIYQTTLNEADRKRAEIAAALSEAYDRPLKLEDIKCDGGAHKDGRLFFVLQ